MGVAGKVGVNASGPVAVQLPKPVAGVVGATTGMNYSTGIKEVKAEITCATCSVTCTTNYYHRSDSARKTVGPSLGPLSICPLCYSEGRFPQDLSSADFIRIDALSLPSKGTSWSDKETLDLLDAVEEQSAANVKAAQFDWDRVAQKLGRSRDQCILQFLKLPTVETVESIPLAKIDDKTSINGFPFGHVENPVMSTVAFLASMVHPKVAAAAAKAAISELAEVAKEEHLQSTRMDIDQGAGQEDSEVKSLSKESLQQISAVAIGSAAARASVLSEEEMQRLSKLREMLIELQLQKIKVKLSLYEDLEKGVEEDKKDVEQQRLQLFIDRFNLRKMMMKASAGGAVNNDPRMAVQADRGQTTGSVPQSKGPLTQL